MKNDVAYAVVKAPASRIGESLGYVLPGPSLNGFVRVGILFAPGVGSLRGPIVVQEGDIRPATREDFDRFRVSVPDELEEDEAPSPGA